MLREAVASVLAQTYRPIEIVIVDDGSSDETGAVAEELSRTHPLEIRVLHIANGGPGVAREAGRSVVRGEFVQHLDSDDLLLPRKFETQVAALRAAPQCGAAYGWTRFRGPDGRAHPDPWKRSGEAIAAMFPSMLASRWWDTPTPLYRRTSIDAAGPWTNLRIEEDWEYDCRVAALGVRLAYCPEWVCEVRQHGSGHASGHGDLVALRDRGRAHLMMLAHALSAGLGPETAEMQHFARDLFHLGRQSGAAGLSEESRALVEASRQISPARDVRFYSLLARVVGWRSAGLAAGLFDRGRS
jgi:glycosyltransferase involved in cell wall biosynthesis